MKYSLLPEDAFQNLQINAGIVVSEDGFVPSTGVVTESKIYGATSGGISFSTNPTYVDFGEDVDNCPANTWQLKRLASVDPTASGTFISVKSVRIADLVGSQSFAVDATTRVAKITQDEQLTADNFKGLWIIGDYSDVNTGDDAGFLAIHLKNTLNMTGFQIQTNKDAKGTMAFEYHAHYDINNPSEHPYEIYCKVGESE